MYDKRFIEIANHHESFLEKFISGVNQCQEKKIIDLVVIPH